MTRIFRFFFFLIKIIFALIIFIADHILGIIIGAFMGLFKGTSGILNIGIRSFAISLLKKH